jgi:hypothetical protein
MWWTHDPTTNTLQLLSIALGIADVAAAYVLGRLVAGIRIGIGTAALTAIAPRALSLARGPSLYALHPDIDPAAGSLRLRLETR